MPNDVFDGISSIYIRRVMLTITLRCRASIDRFTIFAPFMRLRSMRDLMAACAISVFMSAAIRGSTRKAISSIIFLYSLFYWFYIQETLVKYSDFNNQRYDCGYKCYQVGAAHACPHTVNAVILWKYYKEWYEE